MADEGEISDAELEDGEVLSSEEEEEGPNPSKDGEGASSAIPTENSATVKGPQGEKETDSADHHGNNHDDKDVHRGSSPDGRRNRRESSPGEIYSDDEEAAYFPNRVKSRHRSRDRSPSYGSSGDVSRPLRSDRSRSPVSRRSRRRSISSERGDMRGGGGGKGSRNRRSRSPRWSNRYRSSDEDDAKSSDDYGGHGRSQHRLSNRDRDGFGSPRSRFSSPGGGGVGGGRYGVDSRKDAGRGGNDSDNDSYHYGGKGGGRGRKFGGYGQTKNYQQRGGMGKRFGRGPKTSGNYGGYSGRGYHGMGGNIEMRGTVLTQEEITSRRQAGRGLLPPPKERQCDNLDQFNYPAEPSWYLEEVAKWEKREEEKKATEEEKGNEAWKNEEAGDGGKKLEGGEEANGVSGEKGKEEVEQRNLWWIDNGTSSEVRKSVSDDDQGAEEEMVVAPSAPSTSLSPGVGDGNEAGVVGDVAPLATPQAPCDNFDTAGVKKNEDSGTSIQAAPSLNIAAIIDDISPAVTEATPSVNPSPLMSPTFQERAGHLLITTPPTALASSASHGEVAEKDGATSINANVSISQVAAAESSADPNPSPARIPPQVSISPSPNKENNVATESASTAADVSPAAAEPSAHTDNLVVPMDIDMSSPSGRSATGSVCASQSDVKVGNVSDGDAQTGLQSRPEQNSDLSPRFPQVSGLAEKAGIPDGEKVSSVRSSDVGMPDVTNSAVCGTSMPSREGVSTEVERMSDDVDKTGEVGVAGTERRSVGEGEPGERSTSSEKGVAGDRGMAVNESAPSDSAGGSVGDDRLKVNPQERGILFSEISRIQVYVAPVNDCAAPLPLSPAKNALTSADSSLQIALETMPISPATSNEDTSQPMEADPVVQSLSQDDQSARNSIETNDITGKIEEENSVKKETLQEPNGNADDDDDAFDCTSRPRKRGRRKKSKEPPAFRPKLLSESDSYVNYDDYLDQLVDEEEDDEEPLGKGLEDVAASDGSSGFPLGSKEDARKAFSVKSKGNSDSPSVVAPSTGFTASNGSTAASEGPKGVCSVAGEQQVDSAASTKEDENGDKQTGVVAGGQPVHQLVKQPPPVVPQRYKKGVCKYYMNNFCVHGDNCEYSHAGTPTKKKEICKFYLVGTCNKGSNCNYYHGEYPCKFYHVKSYCKNGDRCKFSHAPLTPEMRSLFCLPTEGEKTDPVPATSNEPTPTDDSSLIVSISLSKLEERLKLKAFSIPKLKPPPTTSVPSSTSFPSSMASDVHAPLRLPMGQPPFPLPPNPAQLLFPILQKGNLGSNTLSSPVPLFPPKAPSSTLISSLAQAFHPPRGVPPSSQFRLPGFPLQSVSLPNPPSIANQAPPIPPPTTAGPGPPPVGGGGESTTDRKGLLPTPPISMRLPPDGYKTMKQVEYWEDSSVAQESESSADTSSNNADQTTHPSTSPYVMPSSSQESLPASRSSSLPVLVDAPNPAQEFHSPSVNPRSQHEVPNQSMMGMEPPHAGSRIDPRQSRLAVEKVGESDPRLGGQWHSRQSDHRSNPPQVSMFRDSAGETGMSVTPYQADIKKHPYRLEPPSGSTPYQLATPTMSSTKQQDQQRHFPAPAEKPLMMWGAKNGRSPEHPASTHSANIAAYKPQVGQPNTDSAAQKEPLRRVDPRLKYAHLKIKSKKGPSEGTLPVSQSSLALSSSSASILKKDENTRDHSAFEVPKLLQDPSSLNLNKPIDPRDLFKNSAGGSGGGGELGYGEDASAGPFGMFRSNLFSSRAQSAQEGTDSGKNQQQFGEITLTRTTPPREGTGSVEGTKETEGQDTELSSHAQLASTNNSGTDESGRPAEQAQTEVPSYLAQLDVGVGKDLKIESALGALGSRNTDEDNKKEDEELQARKLPDIFVGF